MLSISGASTTPGVVSVAGPASLSRPDDPAARKCDQAGRTMSENIPPAKKARRKGDQRRLPTPPPDPRTDEDLIAYLDALHKSSAATFGPIAATEDAFDHLEKLYKLMDQILELRVQNTRLHRKIRDLEHLSNLERMHRQVDMRAECPDLDKNTNYAETILESILADSKHPKGFRKIRQSIYRRARNRSGSVSGEKMPTPEEGDRRASMCGGEIRGALKTGKVSKWTKVKAAFKWERAAPNVSDTKSQDSGLGGIVPVNLEVARYLRVPSTCEDTGSGHSPSADSGAAEFSTPGTLSTASSTEDFHHHHQHRHHQESRNEDFRSSDDEHSYYTSHSKEGSQKSNKSHKTPWAKMKDIIHTRNSFKKKHRLSSHSDDIQIDVEPCTDNEDVFDNTEKKLTAPVRTHVYNRVDSTQIAPEIVERYQEAVAQNTTVLENSNVSSKWTRVKNAFLPPLEMPLTPQDSTKVIQDEIQQNYKQLQKKLSLEFQEKLTEWDRMKQNSPGASNPSSSSAGFIEEPRDAIFMKKMEEWQKIKSQPSMKGTVQMTSEENLPPDFRKKLQEWEKIRKTSGKEIPAKKKLSDVPRCKSLSGPKSDNSPVFDYPHITDDFKKKLQEWKQIKSSAYNNEEQEKKKEVKASASPRLARKNSSPKHSKKHKDVQDSKELQWFEKELSKIEKEKQRLERERQKFLEREETLSKLRNSVTGCLKKEVLIHTPCGFYRFEGISRKFTQKLYEWEKSQGIAPEYSTFALLNSSLGGQPYNANPTSGNSQSLIRSKSADSLSISALNAQLRSQPSSLSLNDVDDLEKECLAESKAVSVLEIDDEPEALIVEFEDIIEETAAPLRTFDQKIQQPIYQREKLKALCEGETVIGPKVRRSESARAQSNYNLIEEVFTILRNITENELEIQKTQDLMSGKEQTANSDLIRLKMLDESQKAMSCRLVDKVMRLQEANSSVFTNLGKEGGETNAKQIQEMLEVVQDLSLEITHLTERLDAELSNRNVYEFQAEPGACSLNPVTDLALDIRNKMLELRRKLSYICAASDLTAPRRRHSSKRRRSLRKTLSNESKGEASSDISRTGSDKASPKERIYVKSESSNVQSQGAIKKRIKHRQKSHKLATTDTEEDENSSEYDLKWNPHKKLTRAKTLSESNFVEAKQDNDVILVDESLIKKVVVPTQTVTMDPTLQPTDSPVTVLVKTTRKIFTPFIESNLLLETKQSPQICVDAPDCSTVTEPVVHLPPLPASPTPLRKVTKDISPSIRLMLAKYNQKISEQDSPSGKSGGSSGSNSPVAWRSPTAERRVRAQTEKYQESLSRQSPLLGGRREVQKSASLGGFHNQTQITVPEEFSNSTGDNICKSSSALAMSAARVVPLNEETEHQSVRTCSEIRLRKLQKAKEEFLKAVPGSPPVREEPGGRNRLSQISVESNESGIGCAFAGALMKSASAGMINVDAEVYRQFDAEVHGGGYVSLPRCTKQPKEGFLKGKFAFASIASKFRKVKMRKGANKSAVSALCRQSLVVDPYRGETGRDDNSEDASLASSKGWMRKARLFKK